MRFVLLMLSLFMCPLFLLAEAFTGKITGNNVRMRLAPNLDAPIFKECNRDDLVLVTDSVDDFCACMPPKGLKGYIFRTYVLDGVVEGSNVFVRLGPDRASPAVTVLNSGDHVKGAIAAQNSKWLEIDLPKEVRFYVAKDYVKQVGDSAYFDKVAAHREAALKSLNEAEAKIDQELQKPFPKMQLGPVSQTLTELINDNKESPQIVAQAEALISRMQESYLAKSVAYASSEPTAVPAPPAPKKKAPTAPSTPPPPAAKPLSTISWQDKEASLSSDPHFHEKEFKTATTLHGIIKPYNSFVSSRPGDFVLLNLKTNLPIAYLYSTKVDLAAMSNKPVTIWVSSRPNNNFAFHAYFVHKVEE